MTSSIDTNKPTNKDPSITTIRENFVRTANDINAIQIAISNLSSALNVAQEDIEDLKQNGGTGNGTSLPSSVIILTESRSLNVNDNNATLIYSGSSDIVLDVPQGLPDTFRATVAQDGLGRISTHELNVEFDNKGSTRGQKTFFTIKALGLNKYAHDNPIPTGPVTYLNANLPFIQFWSWNTIVNGSFSGFGTLPTTIFPTEAYVWFPTSAVYANSPAGWYYTTFSNTTTGIVYNNVYISGTPEIPNTLNNITGTGTINQQQTSKVQAMNVTIPGGALGKNGTIKTMFYLHSSLSTSSKIADLTFGNGQLYTATMNSATTPALGEIQITTKTMGKTERQINRYLNSSNFTSIGP